MTLDISVQQRPEIPYIGIPFTARFTEFGAPDGPNDTIPRIYQWLAEHETAPAGGPLYVYRFVGDPSDPVDLTVGVPLAEAVTPSTGLQLGYLPAGVYVVGRHVGSPDGIPAAQEKIRVWAEAEGRDLSTPVDADGMPWTGHAEHFLTDPSEEPDPSKWVTELLFMTV
ncbi:MULTISPECIES: GyrI-like domain-containing protein [unclassified Brevibacterium]|uniref:GyrI-like domain-containing protein n=1 Tax=unclassified Brevibacterium TaxID=2614124 RepID=UPI001092B111|nr:GyrI-like domain-containing protein [Brevibacterium sp. S22]TGD32814.1 GyrI-like domain-containing protein [Brevibacterium sp. S22]